VVVMERTNAMHVKLPEPISLVTIDVAWTKQKHILPAVRRVIAEDGLCITLIKPHYEAEPKLLKEGLLPPEMVDQIVESIRADIGAAGFDLVETTPSPIKGAKGNVEVLVLLRPRQNHS
jgi:23S rRNA (cytidine1920-2'-O)/16S rRNA (cytidine1409-2'-O)-methyltransferase